MISKAIDFIRKNVFLCLVAVSFVFFWWHAVNGYINWYTISKLLLGWAMILPFFFVTEYTRPILKRTFGGKPKYLKLSVYIIIVSACYSVLLTYRFYPTTFPFTALGLFFVVLIWQPFFILTLDHYVVSRLKKKELTRLFILVMVILIYSEFYEYTDHFSARFDIYDFTLLQTQINGEIIHTNLLQFWGNLLPIALFLLSGIPSGSLGLINRWDKKAVFITLLVLIIYTGIFEWARNYLQINFDSIKAIAWCGLSFFYPKLIWAFCEEFIFRGIIQSYFRGKLSCIKDGPVFANVIASIIFALAHFPFSEDSIPFSSAFIYGLVYGWLYNKTQSLWPPILAHTGINLLIGVVYHGIN